jgi:uncharacterized protein (DUF1330 family)
MATVRGVVNFRVKPGRYADLIEGIRAVKKIIERLGANMVVNRQAVGPETGNIIVVVVYESWAAYAKVTSDPELQGLIDTMRNNANPAWDALTVSLNEEVAL